MSLLVVGTMAYDAIETPFGKVDSIIGGAASFISLSASLLTQPIRLVSTVGYDFDAQFLALLEQRGVDLTGVQKSTTEKSFFWSGKYHNDMNSRDTVDTQLNVLANFVPTLPAGFEQSEYVMLGNLTPSLQLKVIEQLKQKPKLIAMDTMNFWMEIALEDLKQVITKVDLITINDEEARQLTGEYSIRKAASAILSMGPRFVVIKKGEHGALLFHGQDIFFAPALPLIDVFDPTGAGDTFAGGLMGYIASMEDTTFETIKNAVIYGSTLASFSVEKFGPERLYDLTKAEVRERYMQFRSLVSYNQNLI
jgi:sugar/nucleoside kinase (ribokinase family)